MDAGPKDETTAFVSIMSCVYMFFIFHSFSFFKWKHCCPFAAILLHCKDELSIEDKRVQRSSWISVEGVLVCECVCVCERASVHACGELFSEIFCCRSPFECLYLLSKFVNGPQVAGPHWTCGTFSSCLYYSEVYQRTGSKRNSGRFIAFHWKTLACSEWVSGLEDDCSLRNLKRVDHTGRCTLTLA